MNQPSPHIPLAPVPGRFAQARCLLPGHPERAAVESFIAGIYHERFGAQLSQFPRHLLAYHDVEGRLLAAVGLRYAGDGPLFLERYLDEPIEQALARAGRATAKRERIAEVGNFATRTPGIARELIVQLAWLLRTGGMDVVAFVATRQLRNAFDRLNLAPVELAIAQASRVGEQRQHWGSYYDTQPRVMCGDLAQGIAFLRNRAAQPAPVDEPVHLCVGAEA